MCMLHFGMAAPLPLVGMAALARQGGATGRRCAGAATGAAIWRARPAHPLRQQRGPPLLPASRRFTWALDWNSSNCSASSDARSNTLRPSASIRRSLQSMVWPHRSGRLSLENPSIVGQGRADVAAPAHPARAYVELLLGGGGGGGWLLLALQPRRHRRKRRSPRRSALWCSARRTSIFAPAAASEWTCCGDGIRDLRVWGSILTLAG